MKARWVTILLCAVVAAVLIWLTESPKTRTGAVGGGGDATPAGDPFAFDAPPSNPVGPAFRARKALAAGETFEGEGTFSFVRSATGQFGGMTHEPTRRIHGTFRSTRRIHAGEGGRLRVSIDLDVEAADSPPVSHAAVRVDVDATESDPLSRKGAVFDATHDLREEIEPVVMLLVGRVPIPDRDVQVGEVFLAKEVVDVEAMRRAMFSIFRFDPRGIITVQGGSKIVSRTGAAPDEEVVVETFLRHAQEGPTSAPKAISVTSSYETVVHARHRVLLAAPNLLDASWSAARRLHVTSSGVDFTVRTDLAASVREHR